MRATRAAAVDVPPWCPMANLISRTDRYVYIRVALPAPTFTRLTDWFGGEQYALRELRLAWQNGVRILCLELPPDRSDGSASPSGPSTSASDGQRE